MTCSISPEDGVEVESEERCLDHTFILWLFMQVASVALLMIFLCRREDGLLFLHEYAIVGMAQAPQDEELCLIKIRNPQ